MTKKNEENALIFFIAKQKQNEMFWDGWETAKSPIILDFPDIWKPGFIHTYIIFISVSTVSPFIQNDMLFLRAVPINYLI